MRIQRSLCLLVAGLFIFLVSNGCVHQIASKTPNVKPPVPSDVRIIPPVQNIPKELAAFSGWWEGEWKGGGYGGKAYLIVEAIYPDKLEVIYCWGNWKKQTAAYDFPPAQIIDGEKPTVTWNFGKSILVFQMGPEHKTIVGTRETPKKRSTITLHKRPVEGITEARTPSPAEVLVVNALKSNQDIDTLKFPAQGRIRIEPDTTFIDERVSILLEGFEPHQIVTLRAWVRDDADEIWESHATFQSDGKGVIDVDSQRPLSGTYDVIDGMGLIWSRTKYRYERVGSFLSKNDTSPLEIIFTAEVEGQLVATSKIKQIMNAPDVKEILVRDEGLVGTFFKPNGPGPFPGIILLSGSGGGELLEGWARILASHHGYATLSLAHVRKEHLPKQMVNIPLEYFETAIRWMQEQESVNADKLAVIGQSRGGELALLIGSVFPQIKAVVAYVPSSVIWGERDQKNRKEQSSWSLHGKPLPFVPDRVSLAKKFELWKMPYESRPIFLLNLENTSAVEKATIPVERIKCPILLISGEDDRIWPSTLMSEMVMERLRQHGHPYHFQHLKYEGAGHNIGIPYGSTTVTSIRPAASGSVWALGGNARDNAFANSDSWPKVLTFLEKSLKR